MAIYISEISVFFGAFQIRTGDLREIKSTKKICSSSVTQTIHEKVTPKLRTD